MERDGPDIRQEESEYYQVEKGEKEKVELDIRVNEIQERVRERKEEIKRFGGDVLSNTDPRKAPKWMLSGM